MSISFIYTEDDGTHITIEFDADCDITELTERFKSFALAVGYHPDCVNGAIESLADETREPGPNIDDLMTEQEWREATQDGWQESTRAATEDDSNSLDLWAEEHLKREVDSHYYRPGVYPGEIEEKEHEENLNTWCNPTRNQMADDFSCS